MAYPTGTIAKGGFGKIYRERYKDTWAAIKKVPYNFISKEHLVRECEVYNESNHPNVVKLLGDITLSRGMWVIPLEFIHGEDLETTIFKSQKSKLQMTSSTKAIIIVGMCEGLLHLHLKDIVHQDLKPENIMVEHGTNRAVIIDLGLAKFFRSGLNSAVDMGNEAYSPPEVRYRMTQRNQLSDVWGMGKIIAELLARVRLFTPSVHPSKIREVLGDQPYCNPVCRMVETDTSRRTTMAGVMDEIRKAAGVSSITYPKLPTQHLDIPGSGGPDKSQHPVRISRSVSPQNRAPDAMRRLNPPGGLRPALAHHPSPWQRHRSPSPFRPNRFHLP